MSPPSGGGQSMPSAGSGGGSSSSGGSSGSSASLSSIKQEFTANTSQFSSIAESSLAADTVNMSPDYIRGADGSAIGSISGAATLARPQGAYTSTPIAVKPNDHSEPVAVNGEFTVDEADVALPGFGVPFVFERHYRSGIDFQTPLGYGWNHTFAQQANLANVDYVDKGGATFHKLQTNFRKSGVGGPLTADKVGGPLCP